MTIEEQLRELINERYGTLVDFSRSIGLSNSTVNSILNRGVHNSSVNNIIRICAALQISADGLACDKIVPAPSAAILPKRDIGELITFTKLQISPETITVNGKPLSQELATELKDLLDISEALIRRKAQRETEA